MRHGKDLLGLPDWYRLMVGLEHTPLPQNLVVILVSVISLRLLAIDNNWTLPKTQLP